MTKAVAVMELKALPVERFVDLVEKAEKNKTDIGDLLDEVLKDVELHYILNVFLNFSKKMLKGMAGFYNLDWTGYIDRFIDYANLVKLTGGVIVDCRIGN